MSGYIIYHYNILDLQRTAELGPLSLPIIEKFGGELMIASPVTCLEGNAKYSHMVAYKFASIEIAKQFYESPESHKLAKLRNEIIEGYAVLVPEFSMA